MEQQEIIEGNRLIAEFMGWQFDIEKGILMVEECNDRLK